MELVLPKGANSNLYNLLIGHICQTTGGVYIYIYIYIYIYGGYGIGTFCIFYLICFYIYLYFSVHFSDNKYMCIYVEHIIAECAFQNGPWCIQYFYEAFI